MGGNVVDTATVEDTGVNTDDGWDSVAFIVDVETVVLLTEFV